MHSNMYMLLKRIKILRILKWKIQFLLWRARIERQSKETRNLYDIYKTYWINPQRIKLAWLPAHNIDAHKKIKNPLEELGYIIGGDWDKETIRFEELDVWQAFKEHFQDGRNWNETAFYKRICSDIETVRPIWGCKTIKEFDERLMSLGRLFEEIKTQGFRSQDELPGSNGPYGKAEEVIVHINRHGDYLFADGRHRLCIAKLAGIQKMPIKVARRHDEWIALRNEILSFADEHDGKIYHPITHPDLADIPASHNMTRIELITPHLSSTRGRLLDIGSNWGFFCHWFEALGYDCTAVEIDPREVHFLKKLKRAENRNFKIIESSIFNIKLDLNFDIVLALNIFHHFLEEEVLYNKLISFLQRLNTNIMFFQPHNPHEKQMQKAFLNYSENEFVSFISRNARLPQVTKIGVATDGRSIYKLARE